MNSIIDFKPRFTYMAANSETPITFLSKTKLAGHLLQIRAAAAKIRLVDKINCCQPTFLPVSLQLLTEVSPGF